MHSIISRIRLPPRDPDDEHRVATPLELLFDLVSVVAIAAITAGLHHAISEGHGLEKLPSFIFVFVAIWWAWMNFTWFASAFDNDGPLYRLLVMVIMMGEVLFAGVAGHIFETQELGWGVTGWSIMRVGMAALWLRASINIEYRTTARRYAIGILIAQLYWIGFLFIVPHDPAIFFGFGALGFVIELAVPAIAERAKRTPFHRHHISERYGLLMIIVLGEMILSICDGFGTLYGTASNVAVILPALMGVVGVFCLFWIYFCEHEHLPSHDLKGAFVWGYGHVLALGAVAVLGAATAAYLDFSVHQSHATQETFAWWFGAPLAVFMLFLWATRDRGRELGARAWSLPVASLFFIGAAVLGLPAVVFTALLVTTLLWRVPMARW